MRMDLSLHKSDAHPVSRRSIGEFQVKPIGLGCMNLCHAYGVPPDAKASERLLREALDLGVDLFDTAALYGFGANEDLIGRVLAPHRSRFTLATKGGMAGVDGVRVIDGRPETLRQNCEDSLRRLRTDVIDLYYLHRWDKRVPIEDSVGALADLVRDGKVRSIGLSEVSARTLRQAHSVHPITALQNEYSLWTRNPEIEVLRACGELGIAFVAFSPLGRGFLGGELRTTTDLQATDIRRAMPRFEPAHYARNLQLLGAYVALAQELGCSPAQLALAWLLEKDASIIALPGTTRLNHLRDNMGALRLRLNDDVMTRLDTLINRHNVSGARYSAANQAEIDSEEFADR